MRGRSSSRPAARPYDALGPALGWLRAPLIAVSGLVALFLLVPILVILPSSLSGGPFLGFPPKGISLTWYHSVIASSDWREAFARSGRVAGEGAVIATAAGTAAALGLTRLTRGGNALRAVFIVPLVIPSIVYALGLYTFLNRFSLLGPEWPVAVGQAMLSLPVVVIVVSAALAAIDPALLRAAAGLGMRWPGIILRIELPLVKRSLAGAFVIAFTLCFDEVVVALFVGAPGNDTVPAHLWNSAQSNLAPDIAAVSIIVILTAFVGLGLAAILLRRRTATPLAVAE
jgi:putative spermidine/putrescine transport system permease protein